MNSFVRFLLCAVSTSFLTITASAAITGQWDFDNTTDPFVAGIGAPIQYFDPNSDTPAQTQGGTTTSFGIPNIAGTAATVMRFGTNGFGRGYLVPHGAAANGGGGQVNNWTIIMDVLFPAESTGKWRALIQTDPFNSENDDAELYIDESDGIGISSAYHGDVPANTWVRLAFVSDANGETPILRKYINGALVGQHTGSLDGRFTLWPDMPFVLFTDGYVTDVYTQPGFINSLQVHDEALSDAYIAALAAPAAQGIPSEVQVTPFASAISPSGTGASPEQSFSARIVNGITSLDTNSIRLTLNGQLVTPMIAPAGETMSVTVTDPNLFPPGSTNQWILIFADDATPANFVTNVIDFVVANYQTINLPPPIYFEDFESSPEGELPPGWTNLSFTEITNSEEDLSNLDSATYARWTVVDSSRFLGTFVSYSDPNQVITDYMRVLDYAPTFVISNGLVKEFAIGKFAFGNSGYRNGLSQVLDLYTPDFNLAGHANVHLAFHSIWEQNQDSIAGVEYSTDQGATWKPVIYMLERADLVTNNASIDAVATFTAEHPDPFEQPARYFDNEGIEQGGTFGSFIKAPITEALAPYLGGRIDDDPRDSKRIELIRLPDADNQANVRFRFFHAGTDSWYFGIDNFGLYSFSPVEPPGQVTISKSGSDVIISIPPGARLQKTTSLSTPDWQVIETPSGATSHTETAGGAAAFYRAVTP